MSDDNKINEVTCGDCGILFGLQLKVEKIWRESGKHFFCPNGHTLHWDKPVDTPDKREIKTLTLEVKSLKEKLEAALSEVEAQSKTIKALTLELEIWKPTDAQV